MYLAAHMFIRTWLLGRRLSVKNFNLPSLKITQDLAGGLVSLSGGFL